MQNLSRNRREKDFSHKVMLKLKKLKSKLFLPKIPDIGGQVMFERTKLEKEEGRGRESSISEPISKAAADPTADSAGRPARGADVTSTTPFSKEGRGRETSISDPSSKSAADPTAEPARGADATSAPPLRPEELEQVAARAQIVELSERLKKLNAYSSFLNILTFMHLTWHLVYLGQHLHVAC